MPEWDDYIDGYREVRVNGKKFARRATVNIISAGAALADNQATEETDLSLSTAVSLSAIDVPVSEGIDWNDFNWQGYTLIRIAFTGGEQNWNYLRPPATPDTVARIFLLNHGTFADALVAKHDDGATGQPSWRFDLAGGDDYIFGGEFRELRYDPLVQRWRILRLP